jgi:hypothetical protein
MGTTAELKAADTEAWHACTAAVPELTANPDISTISPSPEHITVSVRDVLSELSSSRQAVNDPEDSLAT